MGKASKKKASKKKAGKKKSTKKKSTRRKRKVEPRSRGLESTELATDTAPKPVQDLVEAIAEDGGTVLASYREPLGGHWGVLAGLPIDKVEPTPFQRDLSKTHRQRLAGVIEKLDRFLDPIILVRRESKYWTPNGNHRLAAMRDLGAKSIVGLVLPEQDIAYKILALNTEKAHNLREKCLEVVRMARELAELDPRPERDFELEFEEPAFLTLGCCYESRGRFSGGAYNPVLKRIETFLDAPLPEALEIRAERAQRVLQLEDTVKDVMDALSERGFQSPYLRNFVVARINPLRFKRGATGDFDDVIDTMIDKAENFDVGKIRADQLARTGGASED